jgi:hypothetical protein
VKQFCEYAANNQFIPQDLDELRHLSNTELEEIISTLTVAPELFTRNCITLLSQRTSELHNQIGDLTFTNDELGQYQVHTQSTHEKTLRDITALHKEVNELRTLLQQQQQVLDDLVQQGEQEVQSIVKYTQQAKKNQRLREEKEFEIERLDRMRGVIMGLGVLVEETVYDDDEWVHSDSSTTSVAVDDIEYKDEPLPLKPTKPRVDEDALIARQLEKSLQLEQHRLENVFTKEYTLVSPPEKVGEQFMPLIESGAAEELFSKRYILVNGMAKEFQLTYLDMLMNFGILTNATFVYYWLFLLLTPTSDSRQRTLALDILEILYHLSYNMNFKEDEDYWEGAETENERVHRMLSTALMLDNGLFETFQKMKDAFVKQKMGKPLVNQHGEKFLKLGKIERITQINNFSEFMSHLKMYSDTFFSTITTKNHTSLPPAMLFIVFYTDANKYPNEVEQISTFLYQTCINNIVHTQEFYMYIAGIMGYSKDNLMRTIQSTPSASVYFILRKASPEYGFTLSDFLAIMFGKRSFNAYPSFLQKQMTKLPHFDFHSASIQTFMDAMDRFLPQIQIELRTFLAYLNILYNRNR